MRVMKNLSKLVCACFLGIMVLCGSGIVSYAETVADETTEQSTEESTEETTEETPEDVPSEPEIKVLMIGNSFTKQTKCEYGVGSILEELAAANNKKVSVTTIAHGSAYLSFYSRWSETYKHYFAEFLCQLWADEYDYVIIQDQTKAAIEKYSKEMLPAATQLCTYIREYQTQAKILFYETASYENGTQTKVDGESRILTLQEFQERTLYGYTRLSNELWVTTVPVGMKAYYSTHQYPAITMVGSDKKHPSYAGYYLAAACFYYEMYKEKPVVAAEQLTYCNISDEQLAALNSLVDDTIRINQRCLAVKTGMSEALHATVRATGSIDTSFSWRSLNPDIAMVDAATGIVTGVAEGTTAIVVESSTGLMDVCCVTVENAKPPRLSFSKTYYQTKVGRNIRKLPTMENWKSGDTCKWTSSNKSVATVTSDGKVTARKMGKAVITVTSKKDASVSASYTLYVTDAAPSNLTAEILSSNKTDGMIKLSWDKVPGAIKYKIYCYSSRSKTYKLIGISNTNSYIDDMLTVNKNYYYKVCADAGDDYTTTKLSKKLRVRVPKSQVITEITKSRRSVRLP